VSSWRTGHSGHTELFSNNHVSIHAGWNLCRQGRTRISLPGSKFSTQIVQDTGAVASSPELCGACSIEVSYTDIEWGLARDIA
jgi:hypothetical protein